MIQIIKRIVLFSIVVLPLLAQAERETIDSSHSIAFREKYQYYEKTSTSLYCLCGRSIHV